MDDFQLVIVTGMSGGGKTLAYRCMRFGSLFDATQTLAMPIGDGNTQVQVVSWYDNENSYTSQMVRTIKYFAELA